MSSDISGCATSSDVDSALSVKRDLLDLLYMVKPQSPDAFDKWVLTGPIEKYSKVVLAPYDDPDLDPEAGEMAWGWWADEVTDGRCAYLTWNGESIWTLLVRDGLLTYLSASTSGEWDDLSVSFTGENGEWVIDRAAEADMLALDGNVKKWVENQNYLTGHQDITGKQDKISVDGILSCDGDGNVAAVRMP